MSSRDKTDSSASGDRKVAGWRIDPELIKRVSFAAMVTNEKPSELVERAVKNELDRIAKSTEFEQKITKMTESLKQLGS